MFKLEQGSRPQVAVGPYAVRGLHMREDQVIDEVNRLVREVMGDDPVHGYPHVLRVLGYCLKLASTTPGISMFVLKLAALLHDVGRFRSGSCLL